MEMSKILACDMSNCVYNKENRCHTMGITVGPHAECNTFSHVSARGGFDEVKGGVGACLASSCRFNDRLECKAPDIDVASHDRHPDCKTFQPKK
jgi:hypothetical protein